MKQRNHPRLEIKNLSVDASDGVGFFQGMISDVSRFGVCLTDLPKKLNGKAKIMTVVVSGQGKNFKMSVRPRWSNIDGNGRSVGAEILNPRYKQIHILIQVLAS